MKAVAFLRSVPKPLNRIAFLSLSILAIKVLYLNNIPAPVRFFYDLGVLTDALAGSVVASYIFYLVQVHIRELENRKLIEPLIAAQVEQIVRSCSDQVIALSNASSSSLRFDSLEPAALRAALSKIETKSDAPGILMPQAVKPDWLQYFGVEIRRSVEFIYKTLEHRSHLDQRLVVLLTQIKNCGHFTGIPQQLAMGIYGPKLDVQAHEFYEYCDFCRSLDRLACEVLTGSYSAYQAR